MRYRRLGRTELMVSEVGLEVRATLAQGAEAAAAALRSAIDGGITVFTWDVSDAAEDVEHLLAHTAGLDRGRLTLVAILDQLPPPEELGPQVEAIAARLGETDPGYLDVIALPGVPDAKQLEALEDVRRRGLARFVGFSGGSDAELPSPLPPAIDVLLLRGAPSTARDGGAVIARASQSEAAALLAGGTVACVAMPAVDIDEVSRLLISTV